MDISRRSFLKGTVAVAAAVPFIKADRLMNVWTPPEPEIFTGYGVPDIITDIDAAGVTFTVSGLVAGTQVALFDGVTHELIGTTVSRGSEARFQLTGARQRKVMVRARHKYAKAIQVDMDVPFGVELHRVHLQQVADRIVTDDFSGWRGRSF